MEKPIKKKINPAPTSWGNVAKWYDETVEQAGSYQQDLILPNLLRLMEIKNGESVLDLACGQGFFSRAFHGASAKVIGADISKELIAIAIKKSPKEIVYHTAPADALPFIKDGSIDKVAIVLALQNIEDMNETFKETARVLRQKGTPPHQSHISGQQSHIESARSLVTNDWCGGKLYLVLNHPAFRIPKESSWGFDESANVQYRRIDRYLSHLKTEIDMHPGNSQTEQTISFHRPLQTYVKALFKHHFTIRRLEEWSSNKKSQKGPRVEAEDRARAEIPLFMAIETEKTN